MSCTSLYTAYRLLMEPHNKTFYPSLNGNGHPNVASDTSPSPTRGGFCDVPQTLKAQKEVSMSTITALMNLPCQGLTPFVILRRLAGQEVCVALTAIRRLVKPRTWAKETQTNDPQSSTSLAAQMYCHPPVRCGYKQVQRPPQLQQASSSGMAQPVFFPSHVSAGGLHHGKSGEAT